MTQKSYKAIVFDFFGVISSEVAPFWLTKHMAPERALELKSTLVHRADRGEISQDDLFRSLADISGLSAERVQQEWNSYVVIDERIVEFIDDLHAFSRVGLLTNSPSPFVRSILDRYGLSRLFDHIVVSSEHGCAKPEREIYEISLRLLATDRNETLMIDDNIANVRGAIDAGMHGIHFTSYDALRNALNFI
jgi:putative hydrolase of the HAD superfamily